MTWRSIDTLTGDDWYGRAILVWRAEDRCAFTAVLVSDGGFSGLRAWIPEGEGDQIHGVTHWMPLPAPPSSERPRTPFEDGHLKATGQDLTTDTEATVLRPRVDPPPLKTDEDNSAPHAPRKTE